MAVNSTNPFLVARQAIRGLLAQGRGVVPGCLNSDGALKPSRHSMPYNVSQAAVLCMARGLAIELGDRAIRPSSVLSRPSLAAARCGRELHAPLARVHGFRPDKLEADNALVIVGGRFLPPNPIPTRAN